MPRKKEVKFFPIIRCEVPVFGLDVKGNRMVGQKITVDAEVLTVHFNTKKMRIRYKDSNGTVHTRDVPYQPFMEKYSVLPKGTIAAAQDYFD